MVTRNPGQGSDDPTRPATTGTDYTRQPVTEAVPTRTTTTETYSVPSDVTGYAVGTETTDATGGVKDKVAGAADTAREKAGEVAQSATQSIDAQRDTVAGSLDTVATNLRDRAEQIPGGARTTQMAQTAADRIEHASTYLREHEVSDIMTDVEAFVRTHPTQSLLIALGAGFLLGRAVRG
jgi:ElaB/YqjD/DUF883 family membrane-anchored ribosome-binding protein